MTSLSTSTQWHHPARLRYRLFDGSHLLFEEECSYQSTALERALAAADTAAAGKDLMLQAQSSGGWHPVGSLDDLERTTWITFEVNPPRSSILPRVIEFLRNRVRGQLAVEERSDHALQVSVLFAYRDDARAALQRAVMEYPGLAWSLRRD